MQTYINTQPAIDFFDDLNQLQFADQAVTADHIHVALVELAIAAFLRTVGTPYRLDLETLERETDFFAVLHYVPCERNGQVISQTFLRRQRRFLAAVLDPEQQFVAFLAVFAHQRTDILHCRSLDLLEAIQREHAFDRVKDIIAARHFQLSEITCAFRYTWFLCHNYKLQITNYKLQISLYIFSVAPVSLCTYSAALVPIVSCWSKAVSSAASSSL